MSQDLIKYKIKSVENAIQLQYSLEVVNRIMMATSEGEVIRALKSGREEEK